MYDGDVLRSALEVTQGGRQATYGPPSVNLGERTVRLFNAYLAGVGGELNATDVCCLLILVKMARLQESPRDYDTLVDIAGYASAAWDAGAPTEGGLELASSEEGSDG